MSKIFKQQLKALNKKNWLIYKRNKSVILGELLLPIIIMLFVVSIRKVTKPQFNQKQFYEHDGFYADEFYTDEHFKYKPSPFDCIPKEAVGIIGEDTDGIIQETLDRFYEEKKDKFGNAEPYNTIKFDDRSDFFSYIRQYKDVDIVPDLMQL